MSERVIESDPSPGVRGGARTPTMTQVETLRKQALAEIGIRQFSAEGQYADPCVSFVLPDVICSFCNLCRDLDLCRDSRLMDEDEVRAVGDL